MDLQEYVYLFIFSFVDIFLVIFLWTMGRFMRNLKDYPKDIEHFLKNRASYSKWDRFFLTLPMRYAQAVSGWGVKMFGSPFLTAWYRVSGVFMYVFAVFFAMSLLGIWLIPLNEWLGWNL